MKVNTIKIIIFDLGGIFVENYDLPFFEALAECSGKTVEEIETAIKPLMQASERGEISEYNFVKQFLEEIKRKDDPRKIIEMRRKATKEISRVRNLVTELKKHYNVAFATNNAEREFAYNNKTFGFTKLFDYGIASCHAHSRKTEKTMFKMILQHFNVKPKEAVFMDDSIANLKAPEELGIHTFQYISLEQAKKELKRLRITIE